MNVFAKAREALNSVSTRKPYDFLTNNCAHFIFNVLEAGGMKDLPSFIFPTSTNMLDELMEEKYKGSYEVDYPGESKKK